MGGINPNIALSYQAPQFQIQNPIQTIGSIYSLKNLMTEGQLKNLQIQQAQLTLAQAQREEQQRKEYAAALAQQLQPQTTTAAVATPQPALAGPAPSAAPLAVATPTMSDLMNLPTVDRAAQMASLAPAPDGLLPLPPPATALPPAAAAPAPSLGTLMAPTAPAPAPAPVVAPVAPVPVTDALSAAAPRIPSATLGLSAGEFLARYPDIAPGILENQNKFLKAQSDQQKADHENQAAVAKAMGGYARGVEAAQDKPAAFTQAVLDAVSNHYLTSEQGRVLQARGYRHDDMTALIERADDFDKYHTAQKDDIESLAKAQENAGNWMKGVNDQATYSQGYAQLDPRVQQQLGPVYSPALRDHAISWTVQGQELPKMQMGQRQADAMTLAVKAAQGPAALNAELQSGKYSPDTVALFTGSKDGREVMDRALNPDKYAEETRLNRQQLLDAERVRLERQKFDLDKQKYDTEYGPNTVESAAAQIYANPDSVREVLGKLAPGMYTQVQNLMQSKYGMPMPVPLESADKQKEGAALMTKGDADWIRTAMQNPNIANNVGAILGNLQNVEQATGMATGLTGADVQMAQQFRTRMRELIAHEAAAFRTRGVPSNVINDLVASSPRINMDAKMLQGALDGVESGVRNTLDTLEGQRWGAGRKRPPETRGLPADTVKMKAPDGTVRDIPTGQVDHYKSLGATVVQ